MKILSGNRINCEEWSRLVQTSATGTWFQTPEAYSYYESLPDVFRPFVVAVATPLSAAQHSITPSLHEQVLRALCVGYVTVEKNPIKQFFTRRAIILGGPVIANDATDEEVETLMNAVRNQLEIGDWKLEIDVPIFIETRNFNDYSRWKEAFEKAGFAYRPHLNFHVDPKVENLSENRCRQIRKAKTTVECLTNESVSELEIREWYKILSELYRTKVKTPLWPEEFFLEAYRQRIGTFLLVKHEGKIIGGTFCVMDESTVYEWFECGLNNAYKEQYPSVMATYAGMRYAADNGYARYDMMGAGEPGVPYGVRDFKAEFGGTLVEHGRFLHISKPFLYKIGKMAVRILKG